MDIIIDAVCTDTPPEIKPLISSGDVLVNLLNCLGYDANHPPLAQLLAKHYQLEGEWLILTPMHWQATHNNASILAYGDELGLDDLASKRLFESFSNYLKPIGMVLHYHNPCIWLLSIKDQPFLKTKPIHQMLGKPLIVELAEMDVTMYWQKFLTESQMFFSSYHSESVVNGLWIWGSGVLTEKNNKKIITDEHFFEMAQLCSTSIKLYDPSSSLKECDLLLLRDISALNKTHQEQLKQKTVFWYWNNQAYAYAPVSWYTRLWRTLIHAH